MRITCIAIIAAFWLAMMSWLVARDIVPPIREAREAAAGISYADLLKTVQRAEEVRMAVFLGGRPVGRTYHQIRPASDGGYVISSQTHLDAAVAWTRLRTSILYRAAVGPDRNLVSFEAEVITSGGRRVARVAGSVVGRKLHVRFRFGDVEDEMRMDVDPRYLVSSSTAAGLRLPDLYVGKEWRTRSLDARALVAGRFDLVHGKARVTHQEEIAWEGDQVLCYVVEMSFNRPGRRNATTIAWVNEAGDVIMQRAPGGLTFIREKIGFQNYPGNGDAANDRD